MAYHDDNAGIFFETDAVAVNPVVRTERSGRREITGGVTSDATALAVGLASAGFEIAGIYDLDRRADLSPVRRIAEPQQVRVAVKDDESAVILVESRSGLLTWQLPDHREQARSTRGMIGSDHVVFELDDGSIEPDDASRDTRSTRSFAGGWVLGQLLEPLRTYVLRFLARRTIGAVTSRIEGDLVTGPVPIHIGPDKPVNGADPASWLPATVVQTSDAPFRRILLLVHGTFSTTRGSFGQLAQTQEGEDFLGALPEHYDLVLGFDHKTLADTPLENARAIAATLAGLRLHPDCQLDAIAYSRGGLVYRILAEQILPGLGLELKLGKTILVGCTNAGTHLAAPENWRLLADTYTNVAAAAAGGVGALFSAGLAGQVATEMIKTVGRFVQILPEVAITDSYLPGLAAMAPEGSTVMQLNGPNGAHICPALYHAVSSSFEPHDGPSHGLSQDAARFLLNRVTDRLFQAPNDLVVDTASMTEFGEGRSWIDPSRLFAFGDTGDVYHTTYFGTSEVASHLSTWLIAGTDTISDQGREIEEPEKRVTRDPSFESDAELADDSDGAGSRDDEGFGPGGGFGGWLKYTDASLDESSPPDGNQYHVGVVGAAGDIGVAGDIVICGSLGVESDAANGKIDRYIAAEMQQFPRLSSIAQLFVTVSADLLPSPSHDGSDALDQAAQLDPGVSLEITVEALSNCIVVGDTKKVIDRITDENTVRFQVEGLAPGPAQLLAEVKQAKLTVASLTLKPEFIAGDTQMIRAVGAFPAQAVSPARFTTLRIYEHFTAGQLDSLRYDLQGRDPDVAQLLTQNISEAIDLDLYLREVIADAEKAWNPPSQDGEKKAYDSFISRFSAKAMERTEALVPAPILQFLWDHRNDIDAIQVISENPLIPWELMYLSDPSRQSDEGGFFAEYGLVRWLHGATMPGQDLELAEGNSFWVVPDYLDARANLSGAQNERAMLEKNFKNGQLLVADSLSVVDFLRHDAATCDLLHFACHGKSDNANVMRSELMMRGISRDGRVVPDSLSAEQVRQFARFSTGKRRGLVFLNACQAGQAGYGLSGASGFADAFIRPASGRGVAAFVGALWSIDDRLALNFAQAFYEALDGGFTLVEAQKAARKICQTNNDLTWLSYTIYGNPFSSRRRQ